jgi:hypothetical protein
MVRLSQFEPSMFDNRQQTISLTPLIINKTEAYQ